MSLLALSVSYWHTSHFCLAVALFRALRLAACETRTSHESRLYIGPGLLRNLRYGALNVENR